MEFAVTADAVGVIAAVNVAKVKGRNRQGKAFVPILTLEFVTPIFDAGDDIAHPLQCADAVVGIAGVPRPSQQMNRLHHHPFVGINRAQ